MKRYLGWISVRAEVFNVGKYRREATPHPDASFFDMSNPDGEKARRAAAEAAVDDMLNWFEDRSNTVAILDATNSTKSRRKWIYDRLRAAGLEGLFENQCSWFKDARLTFFGTPQPCSLKANVTMTPSS